MSAAVSTGSAMLDRIDRQILHALQLDPRAGYARIGSAIGVSEQTVARRYQRMRAEGLVRVIGLVDQTVLGRSWWTVRIGCRPGTVGTLADALARMEQVSWISIVAGGSELVVNVRGPLEATGRPEHLDLLGRLPRASTVLTMSAHSVLHRFARETDADWVGLGDRLDDATRDHLLERPEAGPTPTLDPPTQADRPLLDALARDGRASYAALAATTGWPQSRVARRVAGLRAAGVLYFDVDLAVELLGFRAIAIMWLTVSPAHLVEVGERLAQHVEVTYAAAITGAANLFASVACPGSTELYRYITTEVAAIDAVQQLEISPVLTRVKQAGSRVDRGRLSDPAPPPGRRRGSSHAAEPAMTH